MRYLIFLICLVVLQTTVCAQEASGIFYSQTDTLYQMVDPNVSILGEEDDELHWNYSEAQAPCYHEIVVSQTSANKIEFNRADGTSFLFRKQSDKALILDSYLGHDPFFNSPNVSVKFQGSYYLLKNGHQLHDQFNSILSMRYTIPKPSSLDSIPDFEAVEELRVHAGKYVKAHVEDQGRLYLPIGNSNCTLVSYEVRDYVKRVELLIDGDWQKPTVKQQEKLRAFTKDEFYFISRYFSKSAPYILAELKHNNKSPIKTLDFYDDEEPSVISSCDQDGVNIFLYPNPSFGIVKVQFIDQIPDDYSIVIYNIIGKPMMRRSLKTDTPNQIVPIDFGDIPRGTYFYGILDGAGNRILSKKLIILSI